MNRTLSRSISVSEHLLHAVAATGTRAVFGVPGPSISEVFRALSATDLTLVVARHEGGAAFMADGYARVSGRIGLCLTTSGPGATNAATGVLAAHSDGSPLLLVVGESSRSDTERGAFQTGFSANVDVLAMFQSISGHCARIEHPEQAAQALARAFDALRGPRPMAAVLGLHSDVALRAAPPQSVPTLACPAPEPREASQQWQPHFEALLGAERPLLFLGTGARRALDDPLDPARSSARLAALTRICERHSLAVVTSPRAKGVFPEDHPCSLGGYGIAGNPWSHRYIHRGTDVLMVVGSRLGEWTTGGWDRRLLPCGPLIHVDVDGEVPGRSYAKASGVRADAALFLDALIDHAASTEPGATARERSLWLREHVRKGSRWSDDLERASLGTPLKPQRIMNELQAVLNHDDLCRGGVNLFCEIGDVLGWACHHLVLGLPHRWWCNTTLGAIGWASSAVIGGQLATPERPAIALVAERGMLMNGAEISSAVEHGVGAVWLVLSDQAVAAADPERAPRSRRAFGMGKRCTADFVGFARSLGAGAHLVNQPGELVRKLPSALESARTGVPQVLVVAIDGSEEPAFPYLVTREW